MEIGEELYIVKCPACSGEGRVHNQFFEQCIHADYRNEIGLEKIGDCDKCENNECKDNGEFVECGFCDGDKIILRSKAKTKYYRFSLIQ